jgi:hypothetical protein
MRNKFLAIWALGAAIVAFVVALGALGFAQGLGLLTALFGGISDPNRLGVTLSFFSAGLVVTFGMFVIARWWSISDILGDLHNRTSGSALTLDTHPGLGLMAAKEQVPGRRGPSLRPWTLACAGATKRAARESSV